MATKQTNLAELQKRCAAARETFEAAQTHAQQRPNLRILRDQLDAAERKLGGIRAEQAILKSIGRSFVETEDSRAAVVAWEKADAAVRDAEITSGSYDVVLDKLREEMSEAQNALAVGIREASAPLVAEADRKYRERYKLCATPPRSSMKSTRAATPTPSRGMSQSQPLTGVLVGQAYCPHRISSNGSRRWTLRFVRAGGHTAPSFDEHHGVRDV